MNCAIIQTKFINIVVFNMHKSSAQTILFSRNIEFTNFFLKIFIRSVHHTGETYLDVFGIIQFTNSFHTLSDVFHGIMSATQHFYPSIITYRQSWKTSLLVRSETLKLFLNQLTGDAKYSPQNRGNLPQLI